MNSLPDEAVRHYLSLPYRIALTRDGDDEERPWRASVEELAGCEARGSTATDAAARISAALADWVASARAEGRDVPEPRGARAHSGRLLLRMPQSLHNELAEAAERDQVSLNAYINVLLVTALQSRRSGGVVPPAEGARSDRPVAAEEVAHTARLQRFLAVALTANVAVVAIAVTIAVILLLSAL